MDAFQPPRGYMRPLAPPSPSDPYNLYQQPPARAPVPPLPQPQAPTWYRSQFQYPPPTSQPLQWGPPPHSPLAPPHPSTTYHAPLPPYHANYQYNGDQFLLPPRPAFPPHSQIPQPYPQAHQEWANQYWGYHQNWDYHAQGNAEDWGAKAREWAAAKAASENLLSQSHLALPSRPEEQGHVHDSHPNSINSQQQPVASSSYQQVPDASAGVSSAGFPQQPSFPSSSAFYQQEVPSSYSSVTGNEEAADIKEQVPKSTSSPLATSYAGQSNEPSSLPSTCGLVSMEQPYVYGVHPAAPITSDHPLSFAPGFHPDNDPSLKSNHAVQPNSWTPPVAPGAIYPPLPPSIPSGSQHDPSVAVAHPVSGHVAPSFVRFSVPGLQTAVPPTGSSYGLSAGNPLHPPPAFPEEAYGISALPERPKKASVPNWLKEEILKNKAALGKSSIENSAVEARSDEEDGNGKLYVGSNQVDSKSVDSSKSTEEEEDDEDYVEAARTAAINQEIKRILTEVLLKVTDELFDEIAMKVLAEDDELLGDDHVKVPLDQKGVSISSATSVHSASAKILFPTKLQENEADSVGKKSSFRSPGLLLGLANYASDEDEDDGSADIDEKDGRIQCSNLESSDTKIHQQLTDKIHSEDKLYTDASMNKGSKAQIKHFDISQMAMENDVNSTSSRCEDDISLGQASSSREWAKESNGSNDNDRIGPGDHHDKRDDGYVGKQVYSKNSRLDNGVEGISGTHDEKPGKEKIDHSVSDPTRGTVGKAGERAKETNLRKRCTNADLKDGKEMDKHKRGVKESDDRKRVRSQEEERSGHKYSGDLSREKRRRSPPAKSYVKPGKDSSTQGNDSVDEAAYFDFRRTQLGKRNLSRSPGRSRRRQVSRSPHSRHSQRRHSPYSSLEATRRRRSRSRSPRRR